MYPSLVLASLLIVLSILGKGESKILVSAQGSSGLIKACREDYKHNEDTGFCYKFGKKDGLNYEQASKECSETEGILASIQSQVENDYIAKNLKGLGITKHVWIGLRKVDGKYSQFDDGSTFSKSFWAPGEPNKLKNEDCTEMEMNDARGIGRTGKWNNRPCSLALGHMGGFVCKSSPQCDSPEGKKSNGQTWYDDNNVQYKCVVTGNSAKAVPQGKKKICKLPTGVKVNPGGTWIQNSMQYQCDVSGKGWKAKIIGCDASKYKMGIIKVGQRKSVDKIIARCDLANGQAKLTFESKKCKTKRGMKNHGSTWNAGKFLYQCYAQSNGWKVTILGCNASHEGLGYIPVGKFKQTRRKKAECKKDAKGEVNLKISMRG